MLFYYVKKFRSKHYSILFFSEKDSEKIEKNMKKIKGVKKGGVLWQSGMIAVVHTFGSNILKMIQMLKYNQ